jgi:hypothetical protein
LRRVIAPIYRVIQTVWFYFFCYGRF